MTIDLDHLAALAGKAADSLTASRPMYLHHMGEFHGAATPSVVSALVRIAKSGQAINALLLEAHTVSWLADEAVELSTALHELAALSPAVPARDGEVG